MRSSTFANGRFVAPGEPVVEAEDQGFLLGLALFDTLLFADGCLYFVEEHVDRLRRGARELSIPWPPWDPLESLRRVARSLGGCDAAIRTTLSRGVPGKGATLVITPRPLDPPPPGGVAVQVASQEKRTGDPSEGLKSTGRLRHVLAREAARAAGAFEALMPTEEGDLAEGTTTNLFALVDGSLFTPSLRRGCLPGILRAIVLDELEARPLRDGEGRAIPVRVDRIRPEDLARASEVFLTSSIARVLAVGEVLGLVGGLPGPDGPITRAVSERLAERERRYRESGAGSPGREGENSRARHC